MIKLHTATPIKRNAADAEGPSFHLEEIVAELRNGEFEPFLQPKVALATGDIKGAETLARWRHLLRELGCDIAQGYFIAKPMEADRFLAWAKEWKHAR